MMTFLILTSFDNAPEFMASDLNVASRLASLMPGLGISAIVIALAAAFAAEPFAR